MNLKQTYDAYKKMYLLRKAEEELVKYYYDNKVMSFVHFYIGQEAVACGVCDCLNEKDYVFGNHRSHGHYLAKGGDLNKMVSELLGKETGCCSGKGGSMHMIDNSVNFKGSTPILGSVAPISAGASFFQKMKNTGGITVAFYGDGASEEGVVYETINFASLFKLPLILVVENNLYSVMSKLNDRRSELYNLQKIVEGFGANYISANGNDYFSVRSSMEKAVDFARNKQKPVVLECMVYRHMAHSAPICDDKIGYREPNDTPENRKQTDSVKNLRNELLKLLDFDEHHILLLEKEIDLQVSNAIKYAVESKQPNPSELLKDVYYG